MILTEDVGYKEGAGKEHVSESHLDTECADQYEDFNVCKQCRDHAECKKSVFSEQPVEQNYSSVNEEK